MRTQRISTLTIAALAAALVACGQINPTDAVDLALHEDYAALDEGAEAEDFGDQDLAEAEDLTGATDVAVVDDTADADADLADAINDGPQVRRLHIAVMWGHLRPQPRNTEVTNWSGALVAENAALRVLRTIAFEENDRLLRRPDIRSVPFTSFTAPHADGLLLEVVMHPRLINAPGNPVSVTLRSAAFTDTLVIAPDMRLSKVVRVDDSGNAIAYHVFRRDADGCQEGMLAGRYTALRQTDDGRQLGELKGRYISTDGSVGGKVKGLWGERANGAQVLFAKVIARDGGFKGTLAGRYGEGHFKGRYLAGGRVVAGGFQGLYREAPEAEGSGFFMGRWSLNCRELSSEGTAEQSDEDNSTADAEIADAQ
ncbi:MAG: hypothetical protein ABIJ09_17260 [Pseudomonadota bacterium]